MGYLFVVQVSATAILVIAVVIASGGTMKSAWDQARSIIRTELATEDAESQELVLFVPLYGKVVVLYLGLSLTPTIISYQKN